MSELVNPYIAGAPVVETRMFFARWIRQEILVAPGEEESKTRAEDWLKGVVQKNPKETKDVLPRFKKKYWPIIGSFLREFSIKFAVQVAIEFMKGLI